MQLKELKNKSDEELVEIILKDKNIFPVLIERYQNKLFRYIKRISNLNNEDIEDLLQEIFLKVYKNLNSFSTNLKFSAWIYRIAHNTVISNYRKLNCRPKEIYEKDNVQLWDKLIHDVNIEKNINNDFVKKQIFKVLDKLDCKYKEVLILKYLEEKDYKEISDILKKPISTVGTLLNRARKQFKEIVEKNNIKF